MICRIKINCILPFSQSFDLSELASSSQRPYTGEVPLFHGFKRIAAEPPKKPL